MIKGVTGNEYKFFGQSIAHRLDSSIKLHAIDPWHVDICQNDVELLLIKNLYCLLRARRRRCLVPILCKDFPDA